MAWARRDKQFLNAMKAFGAAYSASPSQPTAATPTKGSGKGKGPGAPGGGQASQTPAPRALPTASRWKCRCGIPDNWTSRKTCRRCQAPAPLWAQQMSDSPAGTDQPESLTPTWANIAAGAPAAMTAGPPQDHSPAPPEAGPTEGADLAKKLASAKGMLAAAKQHELGEEETARWQRHVDALTRELETSRPPDARLRSLLDKKRDREDKATALTKSIGALKEQLVAEEKSLAEVQESLVQIAADIAAVKEAAPAGHAQTGPNPVTALLHQCAGEPDGSPEQARYAACLELLGVTQDEAYNRVQRIRAAAAATPSVPGPAQQRGQERTQSLEHIQGLQAQLQAAQQAHLALLRRQAAEPGGTPVASPAAVAASAPVPEDVSMGSGLKRSADEAELPPPEGPPQSTVPGEAADAVLGNLVGGRRWRNPSPAPSLAPTVVLSPDTPAELLAPSPSEAAAAVAAAAAVPVDWAAASEAFDYFA